MRWEPLARSVAFAVTLLASATSALAHGGSHPTPWPTPGSTPSSGSGGQTTSGAGASATLWEGWWYFNQWRFVQPPEAGRILSGGGGKPTTTGAETERTLLGNFFRHVLKTHEHHDPISASSLALGKIGIGPAREWMEQRLTDEKAHRFVRESAALSLGMGGALTSVPALARLAEDEKADRALRIHAVLALGLLRDAAALPPVLRVLDGAKDTELRVSAATALGLIGNERSARMLMTLVRSWDDDELVRAAAITALGKIPPTRVGRLSTAKLLRERLAKDPRPQVRRSAALVLHRVPGLATIEVLRAAAAGDADRLTRSVALIALAERWAMHRDADARLAARPVALRALQSGRAHERGYAAIALGLTGPGQETIAKTLRSAFKHESTASLRSACAIALGLWRDPESREPITDAVGKQGDPTFRSYCCIALGLYGRSGGASKEVRGALLDVIAKVPEPALKGAAAIALANMGDRQAVPRLLPLLTSKNSFLRVSSVLALGHMRDLDVTRHLLGYYWNESNPSLQALAIAAMGHLAERRRPPALRELAVDFNYLMTVTGRLPTIDRILRLF